MNLQTMLNERQMSMYHLSKISGIPKTTVIDICSGKSNIESCNAKTVLQLSRALGCTMEELMRIDTSNYSNDSGLPKDESRFDTGLPEFLQKSIKEMQESWERVDKGEKDLHWDIYWCDLNSDINYAEIEQLISSKQAWYLRRKYLRMEHEK